MVRAPEDWQPTIRRGRSLARERDPAAVDLLISALRWRYDTARNQAVEILASLGPLSEPRLLSTLESADTAVERRAAAMALGRMNSARATPLLMRALRDPNMSVRRSAAVALLEMRIPEAVPRLVRLLRDESGGVRVLAANVMARFGDRSAVPALVRALRDDKWYVRQAAARALGELRDPRALGALTKARRDARPAVAKAAARALSVLAKSE